MIVERVSEDRLSREAWYFNTHGNWLVLREYSPNETRMTKRHKWRKGDFWSSNDERKYFSKLDRPTEIPEWVIKDAIAMMEVPVAIGWSNNDRVVARVKVRMCDD